LFKEKENNIKIWSNKKNKQQKNNYKNFNQKNFKKPVDKVFNKLENSILLNNEIANKFKDKINNIYILRFLFIIFIIYHFYILILFLSWFFIKNIKKKKNILEKKEKENIISKILKDKLNNFFINVNWFKEIIKNKEVKIFYLFIPLFFYISFLLILFFNNYLNQYFYIWLIILIYILYFLYFYILFIDNFFYKIIYELNERWIEIWILWKMKNIFFEQKKEDWKNEENWWGYKKIISENIKNKIDNSIDKIDKKINEEISNIDFFKKINIFAKKIILNFLLIIYLIFFIPNENFKNFNEKLYYFYFSFLKKINYINNFLINILIKLFNLSFKILEKFIIFIVIGWFILI